VKPLLPKETRKKQNKTKQKLEEKQKNQLLFVFLLFVCLSSQTT